MRKRLFLFISIWGFLFVQCSTSSSKETKTAEIKLSLDSILKKDTIESSSEITTQSEITCPKCGYKKTETLPTEVCLLKYNCTKCFTTLVPKDEDCCVFCSYGSHKCPSMQDHS